MKHYKILVTGASGVLGWNLCRRLAAEGYQVWGTYRSRKPSLEGVEFLELELREDGQVEEVCRRESFDVLIHAAAMTDPDDCEAHPSRARKVNVEATGRLMAALPPTTHFIYCSTDLVFDGTKGHYSEGIAPAPVNVYGETKVEAEWRVLDRSKSTVLRLAKLYSPGSPFHSCFVDWMEEKFRNGERVPLFRDQYRTPLYSGDALRAIERLMVRGPKSPLYHLGGPERLSRYEFGRKFAEVFDYPQSLIDPVSMEDVGLVARGSDCSLDSRVFYKDYDFKPLSVIEGLEALREERDSSKK